MLDILLSWARRKAFYHVYHKAPAKNSSEMPSAYVVCCIFLLILFDLFKCMGQTVWIQIRLLLQEQSDLGLPGLQIRGSKGYYFSIILLENSIEIKLKGKSTLCSLGFQH